MKQKINNLSIEKLGFFLVSFAVLSLTLYIFALNLVVAEGFRRENLEKKAKLLRQEVMLREEFFITRLAEFYDQNAANFAAVRERESRFVSRRTNVAQAPQAFFR